MNCAFGYSQDFTSELNAIGITINSSDAVWLVDDVVVNTPAFFAGITSHDIISEVNGIPIHELDATVFNTSLIDFKILRSGRTQTITVSMDHVVNKQAIEIRNYRVDFSKEEIVFVFDIHKQDFVGNNVIANIYPKDISSRENIVWTIGDEQFKDTFGNLRAKQEASLDNDVTLVQVKMPLSLFEETLLEYYISLIVRDPDGNLLYEADLTSQIARNTVDSVEQIADIQNRPHFQLNDILIQIHRVWQLDHVADRTANGGIFVILELEVFNVGSNEISLVRENFQIINGDEKQVPDVDLMGIIRDEYYYPSFTYPGTGGVTGAFDGHPSFDLAPHRHRKMMVAFEVSGDPDQIELELNTDEQNMVQFELWLAPIPNQSEFTYALAAVDGITNTSIIEWHVFNDNIESLLDIESVEIENCNGVGIRRSSRTFSKTTKSETTFNANLQLDTALPLPIPTTKLNAYLELNFNTNQSEALTNELTEEIEVPPGKIASYDFVWYIVSIEGELLLDISGEPYTIPFKFDDRLRSEVISKPSTDCN